MKNGPYELVVAPEGYPGKRYRGRYAYEHTVVWWKNSGEIPSTGFEIHHVNGNHRDNRIENLVMVTSHEHKQIHGTHRMRKSRVQLTCDHCGAIFFRRGSEHRSKMKNSKSGRKFCSTSCQHQFMVGGTRVVAGDALLMRSVMPS